MGVFFFLAPHLMSLLTRPKAPPQSGQLQAPRPFTDDEIREAFQTFDIDKNMYIGVSELKHVLGMIGEKVSDEEVDAMIRLGDTDGSGQVSFDGFYKLFGGRTPKKDASPQLSESGVSRSDLSQMHLSEILSDLTSKVQITPVYIRSVYKQFQVYDKDKTGRIGYRDFLKVMEAVDSPIYKRLFDYLDTELRGEIDEKVFLICMIMHAPNKIRITERLKISFSLLRTPGRDDNSVNRDSLQSLLRIFFMATPDDLKQLDIATRADRILSTVSQKTPVGVKVVDSGITFDQFMDTVTNSPELVLPTNLANLVSQE
jgi:Ca2+-binding EF-hand superfamily protein